MPVKCNGSISPEDQKTIKKIWAELIRTLGNPNNLQANIDRWFGTNCQQHFRDDMGKKLRKLKSCINLTTINIVYSELDDRDTDTFGAAYTNDGNGGFLAIINFDPTTQPALTLELDSKWVTGIPLYKTPVDRDSAFQTIAHELSHLLMGTDDHAWTGGGGGQCYGDFRCTQLAINNDLNAQTNADNWGYFIEDLR